MKTLTLQTKTAWEISRGEYDTTFAECMLSQSEGSGMYVQTIGLPEAMKTICPDKVTLHVWAQEYRGALYGYPLETGLDVEKGRYPSVIDWRIFWEQLYSILLEIDIDYPFSGEGENLLNYLVNGIYLTSVGARVYGSASASYAPYLVAEYDEGPLTTYGDSPTGFVSRSAAQTFSWHTAYANFPVDNVAQTSATLEWKNGENGTVHSISISGSATTYSMAANTLPASSDIRWRVNAVTAEGTSTGEWQQIRTTDAEAQAVAISPSSGYADSTNVIRFVWRHEIASGTEPTGYEIQTKAAGGSWTTLATGTGSAQFYDAPANTVPSGTIEWRVRTKNAQGTAGSWSNVLQIVVIGAPTVTSLQAAVKTARPELTWQSPDQQAFEVEIGTFKSGLVFGTERRYKSPKYLPTGATTARVRVMNEYRMWSDWASIAFTISNNATTKPVLTVTGGPSGSLSWTLSSGSPTAFQIIRDGEHIATVPADSGSNSYEDKLAPPGTHKWQVRSIFASNDRYGISTAKSAVIATESTVIAALDGMWLDIGLTAMETAENRETRGASVAMLQLAGTEYPTPEIGPQRTHSYTVEFATLSSAGADAFEALLGRIVVCKNRAGRQIVGVMASVSRSQNWAMVRCSATIQEVDKSAYAIG